MIQIKNLTYQAVAIYDAKVFRKLKLDTHKISKRSHMSEALLQ